MRGIVHWEDARDFSSPKRQESQAMFRKSFHASLQYGFLSRACSEPIAPFLGLYSLIIESARNSMSWMSYICCPFSDRGSGLSSFLTTDGTGFPTATVPSFDMILNVDRMRQVSRQSRREGATRLGNLAQAFITIKYSFVIITIIVRIVVKPVIDSAKKHFPHVSVCRFCIDDVKFI